MEIKIKGNLTKGKLEVQPVVISTEYVSNNGISGGQITRHYPIPCYRCNGTIFHICRDGDDMVAFCANDPCMQEDCQASKELAREEYAKRKEKNQFGQIMTGAEKFNMGSSYKHACLSKWVAPLPHQNIVLNWLSNSSPFLVVMGNTGAGKTYLSASILNRLFDEKHEVYYTTHRRFIEEIQRGIEEGKTQHSVIDKHSYKRYLILDDLGAATCSEWQKEMLLELIDRRYSDKLKTVITTNLNQNGLKEDLGQRTFSRLFDQKNSYLEYWVDDKRQDPNYA